MTVLFVINSGKISNPFVETLMTGLSKLNVECTASIDEWWNHVEKYDIIHFQWPEIIFSWRHIDNKDLEQMKKQLEKAKSIGEKMIVTCHNLKPHLKQNQDMVPLYQLIYSYCDAFIHMGEYSFNLLQKEYPQAHHFIIPHHLYDNIYKFDKDKYECQTHLGLPHDKINVLCFGQFRTDEERNLILALRKRDEMNNVNFVTPGFFRHRLICRRPLESISRIAHYIKYRMQGIKFINRVLDEKESEMYFCACDIVLIQRLSILNSGNLPMGFGAGCVVVGPDIGNVGSILTQTKNPTFNPNNIDSVVSAIEYAIKLSTTGKGKDNKEYALSNWNSLKISQQLREVYSFMMK